MDKLTEKVRDDCPWQLGDTVGTVKLNLIFWNFMYIVHDLKWKYNALAEADLRRMMAATPGLSVYCTALASALQAVVKQLDSDTSFGSPDLWPKTVKGKFVTIRLGNKGVDPDMVGNIKTPTTEYHEVRRCYFKDHSVLKIQSRIYDPTMGVIVKEPDDLIWKSCKDITDDLKATADYELFLRRVQQPKPHGFNAGFVMITAGQLTDDEKQALEKYKCAALFSAQKKALGHKIFSFGKKH